MICQSCHKEEAVVHISGTRTTRPFSGGKSSTHAFEFYFCNACAQEHHRAQAASQYGFPHLHEERRTEVVRVMRKTPECAVLRLVRAEGVNAREESSLITSRLPERWQVGHEITMVFTPAELQWMRGEPELGA
jgi:hypothetical protein